MVAPQTNVDMKEKAIRRKASRMAMPALQWMRLEATEMFDVWMGLAGSRQSCKSQTECDSGCNAAENNSGYGDELYRQPLRRSEARGEMRPRCATGARLAIAEVEIEKANAAVEQAKKRAGPAMELL